MSLTLPLIALGGAVGSILRYLMVSAIGFSLLFGAVVLMRMRAELARNKIEARMKRLAAA